MERRSRIRAVGRAVLEAAAHTAGTAAVLRRAFAALPALAVPPVREVLFRQIYFTGVQALGTVILLGVLLGLVIITQVAGLTGGNAELTGRILVWTVVRELGPLFAAVIVIARSSTAVAAELGSMKVRGEIDSLRVMGVEPEAYLVMPRVLAVVASLFVLAVFFQLAAVFGGLALSSLAVRLSVLAHARSVLAVLGPGEAALGLLKSLAFGLAVAGSSCHHGLGARTSITEVPQVTTRAVMQSLFLVVVIDGVITLVTA